MLDIAVAYNRFKFLGWEFLTWLWYAIDADPDQITRVMQSTGVLEIGNRIVLENRLSEDTLETVTIKGDDAGLEEGLVALRKGAVVTEINLIYRSGDQEWRWNLKGESLSMAALKTPPGGIVETGEDLEGAILEKTYLIEQVAAPIDALYRHFIQIRLSNRWQQTEIPGFRRWLGLGVDNAP